ncbi:MAG: hypothetical protein ACK4WK_07045, partial [Anaerolineae bacterium]
LVFLPFIFGFIALIQRLLGNEAGARQTEDAINASVSGLGRNLFLLEVLDHCDAENTPDYDRW